MNFLSNFLALYNSLPEDDVYFVAMRNLLANRSELAEATIYDMAEICAVSRTTLNRLSKLLGYGSFKEFRYDMVRAFPSLISITGCSRRAAVKALRS